MSEKESLVKSLKREDAEFYHWLMTTYGFPIHIPFNEIPKAIRDKREEYDTLRKQPRRCSEKSNHLFSVYLYGGGFCVRCICGGSVMARITVSS